MKNYPKALKRKLLNTVSQIRKELPKHTADPKRDFKRNRKLPFETLCKTILFMSGQSLNVELQRQFHYDPTAATTSAFVQQRGKLLPTAFEEILRRFTYQNRPIRRWNGYTLLAADGSHVQISSNIHDEATYFSSTKNGQPAVESDITHLKEASPCCVAERLTLLPFNLISQAQIQSR